MSEKCIDIEISMEENTSYRITNSSSASHTYSTFYGAQIFIAVTRKSILWTLSEPDVSSSHLLLGLITI
jgi:hypothetical protein